MRLYGYNNDGYATEEVKATELAEVTLVATPLELRLMAKFLIACAASMEELGSSYNHEHLSDNVIEFKNSPHFVVANAK